MSDEILNPPAGEEPVATWSKTVTIAAGSTIDMVAQCDTGFVNAWCVVESGAVKFNNFETNNIAWINSSTVIAIATSDAVIALQGN
jgi:hypothetical protein